MLRFERISRTEGPKNPKTSPWSRALDALKAKFGASRVDQREILEEISTPPVELRKSTLDPLQALAEYPASTTSLATALKLIGQEPERAFSKSDLVAKILSETLKANLEGFPQSAGTLQASLLTIYQQLQSKSPSLISNLATANLAETQAQLSVNAYLGSTQEPTPEAAPNISKITEAKKQEIKIEERKAFAALLAILQEPSTQTKLEKAKLLSFRPNTEPMSRAIPPDINTFNELRQSLTKLLSSHLGVQPDFQLIYL